MRSASHTREADAVAIGVFSQVGHNKKMLDVSRLEKKRQAAERSKELVAKLLSRGKRPSEPPVIKTEPEPQPAAQPDAIPSVTTSPVTFGAANVPLYRDVGNEHTHASRALGALVDAYLGAAQGRSRCIVLSWPAAVSVLSVVHTLAVFERWARGDKLGIRGLLYPAKTNVFYSLNHLLADRERIVEFAQSLIEPPGKANPLVTRSLPDKDAFLFALNSLKRSELQTFHPTLSELIPHFLADTGFPGWTSCAEALLQHTTAKLARRKHKKVLRENTEVLGNPKTAPDALFAMSYRMTKDETRKALAALKKVGIPEVVLLDATRPMRKSMPRWRAEIGRFVRMLHEEVGTKLPGIVVVTDEPRIAYDIRDEIRKELEKLPSEKRPMDKGAFEISALLCATNRDGLLGETEKDFTAPEPRNFRVHLTDSEASKVINRLYRIANSVPGGPETAVPVLDAARFIHRLAALPASLEQMAAWLDSFGANERVRDIFTWPRYRAGLHEFAQSPAASEYVASINEAIAQADRLWSNYQGATPFALKLASLVGEAAKSSKKIAVVFGNATYKRLAERFLSAHTDYPGGKTLDDFSGRVALILSHELKDSLETGWATHYVFAGVDDESLRLMVTDNRLPAHADVLLTQRSGLYLRATLKPIAAFPEFRCFKPRIESLLHRLDTIVTGTDRSILSGNDYVLPTFDFSYAVEASHRDDEDALDAWQIVLDDGRVIYRRPGADMYLYDLAHEKATDQGFRCVEVRSLEPGDKLFVMAPELRELLESVLKQAGVPIEHDKKFEAALRVYHKSVSERVGALFPARSLTAIARALREAMLSANPGLKDLPEETTIRAWVNLGKSADTPFDELKPSAPRQASHFRAFASTLGFSELETTYYWKRVIQPIRGSRRSDGRAVSEVYTHMLLEPESVIVHAKIPAGVIKTLFAKARENIFCVEQVIPSAESPTNVASR
jgi:hypothetical protein